MKQVLILCPLFLVFLGIACQPDPAASTLIIDTGKSGAERILSQHFGGYASASGSDPFEEGLLTRVDGRIDLQIAELKTRHPDLDPFAFDANGDATLDWDELVAFIEASYYRVRALPATTDQLRTEAGFSTDSTRWFSIELQGVMTTARRRISVSMEALRMALDGYTEAGAALHYPTGTIFIGEHIIDDRIVETTAMRKRDDGYWDFMTYDTEGRLSNSTDTPPKTLRTPVQCVGCHLGSRPFEPERSVPEPAPDGPEGPRTLHIPETWKNPAVVTYFDEHKRRSDGVLGLYATLYVSRLLDRQKTGPLSPVDQAILDKLNINE